MPDIISLLDLSNAKLDVDHIAEVATGQTNAGAPITASTDRYGNTIKTIPKVLDDIETGAQSMLTAYAPVYPAHVYGTGTLVLNPVGAGEYPARQVIENAPNRYVFAADFSELPYDMTQPFDDTKWIVVGTTASITPEMIGLGNVDNTSDVDKPISTAQAEALASKAPIDSPTFTGTVGGVAASMVVNTPTGAGAGDIVAINVQTALNELNTKKAAFAVPGQFVATQRTTPLVDNDLSFDVSARQDFICTPAAVGTLTFTNIAAGQKGEILLINSGGYAIAKAANVKCPGNMLGTISSTGTYRLAYACLDGTNVYVTSSSALT